jgi:hypothetical protein
MRGAIAWEDLALAEVAEYTRWSLAQVGFNPNWANDATGALKAALEQFSRGQESPPEVNRNSNKPAELFTLLGTIWAPFGHRS